MTVGTYLKNLRQQKGYTLQEVVEMTGGKIDKTTISRVENDERKPSLLVAYVFSELYAVDMKDLAIRSCGKIKIKKSK